MAVLEKIIYFLVACSKKQTLRFLSKNSYSLGENRTLPESFIKKSRDFFKKNRKKIVLKNDDFSAWRYFCKYSSYEEVLPVILIGILKYDKEKVLWLLNISPEVLSYRLNRGLLFLSEKLKEIPFKKNIFEFSEKRESFQSQNLDKKYNRALMYCQWLAGHDFSYKQKVRSKKTKYFLLLFLCLMVLCISIWLILLFPPSTIILYQSSFN